MNKRFLILLISTAPAVTAHLHAGEFDMTTPGMTEAADHRATHGGALFAGAKSFATDMRASTVAAARSHVTETRRSLSPDLHAQHDLYKAQRAARDQRNAALLAQDAAESKEGGSIRRAAAQALLKKATLTHTDTTRMRFVPSALEKAPVEIQTTEQNESGDILMFDSLGLPEYSGQGSAAAMNWGREVGDEMIEGAKSLAGKAWDVGSKMVEVAAKELNKTETAHPAHSPAPAGAPFEGDHKEQPAVTPSQTPATPGQEQKTETKNAAPAASMEQVAASLVALAKQTEPAADKSPSTQEAPRKEDAGKAEEAPKAPEAKPDQEQSAEAPRATAEDTQKPAVAKQQEDAGKINTEEASKAAEAKPAQEQTEAQKLAVAENTKLVQQVQEFAEQAEAIKEQYGQLVGAYVMRCEDAFAKETECAGHCDAPRATKARLENEIKTAKETLRAATKTHKDAKGNYEAARDSLYKTKNFHAVQAVENDPRSPLNQYKAQTDEAAGQMINLSAKIKGLEAELNREKTHLDLHCAPCQKQLAALITAAKKAEQAQDDFYSKKFHSDGTPIVLPSQPAPAKPAAQEGKGRYAEKLAARTGASPSNNAPASEQKPAPPADTQTSAVQPVSQTHFLSALIGRLPSWRNGNDNAAQATKPAPAPVNTQNVQQTPVPQPTPPAPVTVQPSGVQTPAADQPAPQTRARFGLIPSWPSKNGNAAQATEPAPAPAPVVQQAASASNAPTAQKRLSYAERLEQARLKQQAGQ